MNGGNSALHYWLTTWQIKLSISVISTYFSLRIIRNLFSFFRNFFFKDFFRNNGFFLRTREHIKIQRPQWIFQKKKTNLQHPIASYKHCQRSVLLVDQVSYWRVLEYANIASETLAMFSNSSKQLLHRIASTMLVETSLTSTK